MNGRLDALRLKAPPCRSAI